MEFPSFKLIWNSIHSRMENDKYEVELVNLFVYLCMLYTFIEWVETIDDGIISANENVKWNDLLNVVKRIESRINRIIISSSMDMDLERNK